MIGWCLFFIGLAGPRPAVADAERGRALFQEKGCRLCHKVENPGTVFNPICPGLKDVKTRHSREWLARWLQDPAVVWATGDADVQDINRRYFEYRGSPPRPRESFMATIIGKQIVLTEEEIQHLIDYLKTL